MFVSFLLLLQLGGFKAPFISLGCVVLVVGVIAIFVLPPQTCELLDASL